MTWQETRKTYKRILHNFPEISNLWNEEETRDISETVKHYEKRGGRWIVTKTENNIVSWVNYYNVLDSVPFFRNLGGFERVSKNYTRRGFFPVEITSISPDRTKKTIRSYKF